MRSFIVWPSLGISEKLVIAKWVFYSEIQRRPLYPIISKTSPNVDLFQILKLFKDNYLCRCYRFKENLPKDNQSQENQSKDNTPKRQLAKENPSKDHPSREDKLCSPCKDRTCKGSSWKDIPCIDHQCQDHPCQDHPWKDNSLKNHSLLRDHLSKDTPWILWKVVLFSQLKSINTPLLCQNSSKEDPQPV